MATQKRFIAKNGLDNNSNTITNVADPSGLQDAATKNYLSSNFVGTSSSAYPTVSPSLNLDFIGSRQLDSRITFARNSIATYYDGQTSALAEQNLLKYSQTFASGWSVLGSSIATPSIAPDGTTTALILSEDTSTGQHRTNQQLPSTPIASIVFSVYVKWNVGTRNIVLTPQGTSAHTVGIIFNSSGAYVSTTTGNGTITNYGSSTLSNGWFRFWVNYTPTQASTLNIIALCDGTTNSYVGDGTSSILVWGAQLEQRSSVTAYTPTTTAAITNYIPVLMTAPAGVPRLDYNPTTGVALGLLIEESRTNLLTYSSDFSNAAWTKYTASIITNQGIAPDGTQTANQFSLVTGASATQGFFYNSISATAQAYTHSIYIKPLDSQMFFALTGFDGLSTSYNLATLAVASGEGGTSTGTITSVGNGWYRITRTVTATAGTQYPVFVAIPSYPRTGGSLSWTPTLLSRTLIWGAQLEAGSFATSYIPTVASTVTRAADQASMTGTNFSSWYNISQGTFYAEILPLNILGPISQQFINLDNSSSKRVFYIAVGSSGFSSYDGTTVVFSNKVVTTNTIALCTLAYTLSTRTICVNSEAPNSGVSTLTFAQSTSLSIGQSATCNGHIRKLSYYPVALSSSNLVALTS